MRRYRTFVNFWTMPVRLATEVSIAGILSSRDELTILNHGTYDYMMKLNSYVIIDI